MFITGSSGVSRFSCFVLQGPMARLGVATVFYKSRGVSRFSYRVLQGPVARLGLASTCYNVQWRIYVSGRVGSVVTMPISKKNYDLSKNRNYFISNYLYNVCICYTLLLLVSAIYRGHLQGCTTLIDVYSIYGNMSQMTGKRRLKLYIPKDGQDPI